MSPLYHSVVIGQSAASGRFTPFIDPLQIPGFDLQQNWWLTLIPLALFVSMAYKAVRLPELTSYWRQVALMTAQILVAMVALAAAIYVLVELIVPRLGG